MRLKTNFTTARVSCECIDQFVFLQVEHGDHDNKSLLRFGALWQAHFSHDSLLVYSTGRSPKMFADLRGEVPLLTPAIAVLSCGTEIFYGDSMTEDDAWVDNINKGWSRAAVEEVANEMNLKYQVCISIWICAALAWWRAYLCHSWLSCSCTFKLMFSWSKHPLLYIPMESRWVTIVSLIM